MEFECSELMIRACHSLSGLMGLIGYFQYCPLDESNVRLLHVHPPVASDSTGVIQCTLTHLDTNVTPLNKKAFYALSYTWSLTTDAQTIIVNNCSLTVRNNLWNFLDMYRRGLSVDKPPRPLWIDQICVDQENVSERNHQVKLMADIYSSAIVVLSWLGEAEDHSDLALQYLHHSTAEQNHHPTTFEKIALASLFKREYWFRLMCGEFSIDWRRIAIFCHSIRRLPKSSRVHIPPTLQNFVQLYHEKFTRPKWGPVDILDRFASCHCQNPYDKVFRLMSLIYESNSIEIDYTLNAEAVFL